MKKKILAGAAISISVIVILLSSLFMQSTPSYAAYVRSLPTRNTEVTPKGTPTPIPGVIFTGDYIRIGINPGGTLGVGNGSDPGTGFQYPIGPQYESLAIWWWGEGYVFAYKTEDKPGVWVDHVAYWQPSFGYPPPAACNINPVSFSRIRNDDNYAKVRAEVHTADGALKIRFVWMFPKHMKYVTLKTYIETTVPVKDLIYKRFVDWDIHWQTYNDWSSDSHSVYASFYNETLGSRVVLTVAGQSHPAWGKYLAYAELYGWDDYMARPPFEAIQSHDTPIANYDGAAMITFDLGEGFVRKVGVVGEVLLYYQAGENFLP